MTIRCVIYTRKSTDEGLEKEFNTLEAQREAGENFVRSQKHQAWVLVPDHYDDGGFSGGNMNRPALARLMDDIKAGKVDMIVVYKIDRLTRSLMDFSKMVEVFDEHNCSFVSVTQNFNTADSMGRLMLNVLLSFAQFEREISGERIRDKIAASRKKGMWTGGVVPVGYRVEDKKLLIDEATAMMVKDIFAMYLKYKSFTAIGIMTKEKYNREFRTDTLKHLLRNPVYIGKIKHKGNIYDGQHEPLIDPVTFEAVKNIRATKDLTKRSCLYKKREVGLLRGLITCGCCHSIMTPTASKGHGTRHYYYTSTKAKYYGYKHCHNGSVPVKVLDEAILALVGSLFQNMDVLNGLVTEVAPDKPAEVLKLIQTPQKVIEKMTLLEQSLLFKKLIENITLHYDTMEIRWTKLGQGLLSEYLRGKTVDGVTTMELPYKRVKGSLQLVLPEEVRPAIINHNPELIRALSRAFRYRKILNAGTMSITDLALEEGIDAGFIGRMLRLTGLAPDIIHTILDGRQPVTLCLQQLMRSDIPPIWADQRRLYHFPEI